MNATAGPDGRYNLGAEAAAETKALLTTSDWSKLKRGLLDPALNTTATREAIEAARDLTFHYTVPDFDHAIDLLRQVITQCPDSAIAHAYLASAAAARTHYISDESYLDLAENEANKAVSLSPASLEARRSLAGVLYQRGKLREALSETVRAVETFGPEEKLVRLGGMIFDMMGDLKKAVVWFDLAARLSHSPGSAYALAGDVSAKLRADATAQQYYERAQRLQPDDDVGAIGVCHLRILQRDFKAARAIYQAGGWDKADSTRLAVAAQTEFFARNFERAADLYKHLSEYDPRGGGGFYGAVTYRSALARCEQGLGQTRQATEILQRCAAEERGAHKGMPQNPEAAYRLAAVEACLGLEDLAIAHLQEAKRLGWTEARSLALDPRFDSIRQASAFSACIYQDKPVAQTYTNEQHQL
jgi:tetratricopeptide (TPR) repeat protein